MGRPARRTYSFCSRCGMKTEVIRKYKRRLKSTAEVKQVWQCKKCGKKFVKESVFKGKRHRKEVIERACSLRKDGLSLRKIAEQLKEIFNVVVTAKTILEWCRQVSSLLQKFEECIRNRIQIKGSVGLDEVRPRVENECIYYWNARDRKTKYNLRGILSRERSYFATKKLFHSLKHDFANKPKHFISDKLEHYLKAFKKYFYRIARITHGVPIACKKYKLKHNNNCIERYNGYVKESVKLKRGFKNFNSAFDFLEMNRICLNFIHPLESLGGKAPAEAAGLNLGIKNFKDLLRVALKIVYR